MVRAGGGQQMIRIRVICRVRVRFFYPFDHDQQKPVAIVESILLLLGNRFPQSLSVLFGVLCTNGKATFFQPNTTAIGWVVLWLKWIVFWFRHSSSKEGEKDVSRCLDSTTGAYSSYYVSTDDQERCVWTTNLTPKLRWFSLCPVKMYIAPKVSPFTPPQNRNVVLNLVTEIAPHSEFDGSH